MEATLPLAFTASWASGINPYLVVFLLGLIGRFTSVDVPPALIRTDVLVVMGVLVVVDAVADKVMWLDSAWDVVNTAIRPLAGGALAVIIASPDTPLGTATVAGAGGIVALITHLAKATTRLAVNTSPEPASNVVVSLGEDVAVAGVTIGALLNPWLAAGIALVLFIAGVVIALSVATVARRAWRARRRRGAARRSQGTAGTTPGSPPRPPTPPGATTPGQGSPSPRPPTPPGGR